jgi:hypothetical protein
VFASCSVYQEKKATARDERLSHELKSMARLAGIGGIGGVSSASFHMQLDVAASGDDIGSDPGAARVSCVPCCAVRATHTILAASAC